MAKNSDRDPLIIDADGHILEPPDLWERYLEPRFRDRAVSIRVGDDGYEYVEVDRKRARMTPRGTLATLGGMGRAVGVSKALRRKALGGAMRPEDARRMRPNPEDTYIRGAAFGSMDAGERLRLLDGEGIAIAILYPTLGLLWEAETYDIELSQALACAYNRWIADFCRDSGGRLVPIAHLSLGDPVAAAAELERAVADGCRGAFVAPFTITRKPHGHPDHDPVFAAAQDLGVPLAIHPTFEPSAVNVHHRFDNFGWATWYRDMFAPAGVVQAFATLFQFGIPDRFPRLKLAVLESGGGWIAQWLARADSIFESTRLGASVRLREKPSYYFRRQFYIAAEPGEPLLGAVMEIVGEDRFFWASDYPHADHPKGYMRELRATAESMSESARRAILGENAARAYGLDLAVTSARVRSSDRP